MLEKLKSALKYIAEISLDTLDISVVRMRQYNEMVVGVEKVASLSNRAVAEYFSLIATELSESTGQTWWDIMDHIHEELSRGKDPAEVIYDLDRKLKEKKPGA